MNSGRDFRSPSWDSLVLICKECRRRKNGPKHLKARTLATMIKSEMKTRAPRTRTVLTSCLKLCPKKATSVALVAPFAPPRIAAIKSSSQLQKLLSLIAVRKS